MALGHHPGIARLLDPSPSAELRYAHSACRVRACLGDASIADSTQTVLVWEPGRPVPLYAFPRADVRSDCLRPADGSAQRAHPLAETFDVRAGEREAPASAWVYDDRDLADYVAIDFNAMDRWLEEEDEVFVHPADPFHRVEVRASTRTVRIERDGILLAESRRPLLLFETGLPTRFYLPPDDVRRELLAPTSLRTRCPYKGEATYWSARAGEDVLEDVAWSYPRPLPEVPRIGGLIAFFDERVDVTVDGERQPRPLTPWSREVE